MLVPEISVGLFGLTPDLPLILLWYAAVGLSALGIAAKPGSARALAFALGSGCAVGLACDAKVSGILLLLGLVVAWASRPASEHRRSVAPYAALAVALVLFCPVVLDEIERGFPMLRHRLVDTQRGAGISLRNVAALAGGQLLYVTPPLLFGAYKVGRDSVLAAQRRCNLRLLWSVTSLSVPLVFLSVSRGRRTTLDGADYLGSPLHLARRADAASRRSSRPGWRASRSSWGSSRWLSRTLGSSCRSAPRCSASATCLVTISPMICLPGVGHAAGSPRPRRSRSRPDAPPVVVVGPHWTVCAQLHADLPASVSWGATERSLRRFLALAPGVHVGPGPGAFSSDR